MWVLISEETSVWRNLAMEEVLLDAANEHGGALFFCRNRPCIVFGKNQNPWRECRVEQAQAAGVPVVRRVSGGGAVYHDLGNLNYGLVLPREVYDRDRCFDWVLSALRACGIPAVRMGSTSIGAAGRKLSGTAFAYRRTGVLHHGTLLLQADLAALRSSLRPPAARLQGHAIASEPAAVANALSLSRTATASRIMTALQEAAAAFFPAAKLERVGAGILDRNRVDALARKIRSVEWRFGGIPEFTAEIRLPAGSRICMTVRRDRILRAWIESPPAPDQPLPLRGLRFRPARLAERLRHAASDTRETAFAALLAEAAMGLRAAWR